jgi:hypothetical protein
MPNLPIVRFAQAAAGFGDKYVLQRWLSESDGIDLARKGCDQFRNETRAVRLFDPDFVVQDADLYA